MRAKSLAIPTMALLLAVTQARAITTPTSDSEFVLGLEAYEPNKLGYTFDSDDVKFMDVRLSVKFALFPGLVCEHFPHYKAYVAFTGRFGQYIGNRDSSPVVGKRFNPKLLLRRYGEPQVACQSTVHTGFLDLAYAHESNGQSLSYEEWDRKVREAPPGTRTDFFADEISRGWDYLEATWMKAVDKPNMESGAYTHAYVQLKYFLKNGLLQRRAEEYDIREKNPEGKARKEVNGIGVVLLHRFEDSRVNWMRNWLASPKLTVIYETGYAPAFRHHTLRVEAGVHAYQFPFSIWVQKGYGSDLAQYYKKVSSWGIEVQLGSY